MGLDRESLRFLIAAKRAGVDFTSTATLGRQTLYFPRSELQALFKEFGVRPSEDTGIDEGTFADDVFRMLGAQRYVPIDASRYEGAVQIQNLNLPIPDELKNSFDAVVDGGTLEHVFNYPVALKSCMEMVRIGGHLILFTPANNFCGHGFYQFSPELFFRALSRENGYDIQQMLAYECYPRGPLYTIKDPEQVRARVEVVGGAHRVLLMILAKRVDEVPIFADPPQQSDYVAAWHTAGGKDGGEKMFSASPSVFRRLAWRCLRMLGSSGQRFCNENRARFFNRQLRLQSQSQVFRRLNADETNLLASK